MTVDREQVGRLVAELDDAADDRERVARYWVTLSDPDVDHETCKAFPLDDWTGRRCSRQSLRYASSSPLSRAIARRSAC